ARRLGHHAGGPLRRSVRAALELLASRQARKGHGGPFAHFIAGEPGQRLRAALVEVHAVPARGVPELALPRQGRRSALRRRSPALCQRDLRVRPQVAQELKRRVRAILIGFPLLLAVYGALRLWANSVVYYPLR